MLALKLEKVVQQAATTQQDSPSRAILCGVKGTYVWDSCLKDNAFVIILVLTGMLSPGRSL